MNTMTAMFTIKRTQAFDTWFSSIKDSLTKIRLTRRLERVAAGNLGDFSPVGEGVYELREHFGAGYRLYYTLQGSTLILMLGGGTKESQQRDISQAIALSALLD